jgi:predicted ATPase
MITDLSLNNFMSWKNLRKMKFGKITGIFGANSSGKTSIINMILLLKQSIESPDRKQVLNFGTEKDYIQLGSFSDIIHHHNVDSPLDISIGFANKNPLKITDPEKRQGTLYEDTDLIFSASIGQTKANRMYVNELSYDFSNRQFNMRKQERDKYDYALSAKLDNKRKNTFIRTIGRGWPLPEPVKFYGFPDQVRTYYQNAGFLFDLQLNLETNFSSIFYLGPLREYPQREYTWTGIRPNDMGRKGELFVHALLASRERGERILLKRGVKKLTLEEYIAWWLKEIGVIDTFMVEEIQGTNMYRVKVQKNNDSTSVLITDVGFGVSQILPVITLCYYAPEYSTVIIEQPEIHLHPMVQSYLADVFIDAVQKRHIQLIIESHSEHLLRRLQLRIAEKKINTKDVNLYFCSMEKDQSKITSIQMDLFGIIENWPKDFFGNEYKDIAEMNKAIIQRKNDGK